MLLSTLLLPLFTLPTPSFSQQIGHFQTDIGHPGLQWTQCTAANTCQPINGTLTADQKYRWLHKVNDYVDCYAYGGNNWNPRVCDTEANCTANCALEGVDYRPRNTLGVEFTNNNTAVSMAVYTWKDFQINIGLRFFLLSPSPLATYQTFTLLNNEFTFTVDLSIVGCGLNAALTFVEMDPDGGMGKYPTNKAGARYGTGYCDAACGRDQLFVAGKANVEGWESSYFDAASGKGKYGACCPEFALWKSNSQSYAMGSHMCKEKGYTVCEGKECEGEEARCDEVGCGYSPYRMGRRGFYGEGKEVDTRRPFTVVTRFEEGMVYQVFVQDGKRIETPPPSWGGVGGITEESCGRRVGVFGEGDGFGELGGWEAHREMLRRPMVLAMSISPDWEGNNRWLDGVYPKGADESKPGAKRGECVGDDAAEVLAINRNAKVIWSDLRFGPIGSTIDI
ncbi:Exoglucanase 1 [Podospora aff. communis PSN243]|uniref:Glucanase n=1 Tax=Podospora aff. communis PSN243 TaxID=3040156 RepID=A0AAV9G4E6_9PEZI|nr:Exoglucanase 1 [Podospora aff. communis PSN243]